MPVRSLMDVAIDAHFRHVLRSIERLTKSEFRRRRQQIIIDERLSPALRRRVLAAAPYRVVALWREHIPQLFSAGEYEHVLRQRYADDPSSPGMDATGVEDVFLGGGGAALKHRWLRMPIKRRYRVWRENDAGGSGEEDRLFRRWTKTLREHRCFCRTTLDWFDSENSYAVYRLLGYTLLPVQEVSVSEPADALMNPRRHCSPPLLAVPFRAVEPVKVVSHDGDEHFFTLWQVWESGNSERGRQSVMLELMDGEDQLQSIAAALTSIDIRRLVCRLRGGWSAYKPLIHAATSNHAITEICLLSMVWSSDQLVREVVAMLSRAGHLRFLQLCFDGSCKSIQYARHLLRQIRRQQPLVRLAVTNSRLDARFLFDDNNDDSDESPALPEIAALGDGITLQQMITHRRFPKSLHTLDLSGNRFRPRDVARLLGVFGEHGFGNLSAVLFQRMFSRDEVLVAMAAVSDGPIVERCICDPDARFIRLYHLTNANRHLEFDLAGQRLFKEIVGYDEM